LSNKPIALFLTLISARFLSQSLIPESFFNIPQARRKHGGLAVEN
jgi:hypothetical protein